MSGDSLSKIARDVLGDINLWPDIAKANNIPGPNYIIQPGQVLQLPDKTNAVPSTTTPVKATSTTVTNNNSSSSVSFLGLGVGGLVVLGILTGLVIYKKKKGSATKAPAKTLKK